MIQVEGYIVFQRSGIGGKKVLSLKKSDRWDWFTLMNLADYKTFPGLLAREMRPLDIKDFCYFLSARRQGWEKLKQRVLDSGLLKRTEAKGEEYLYISDFHYWQDKKSRRGKGKRSKDRFVLSYPKLDRREKEIFRKLVQEFRPIGVEVEGRNIVLAPSVDAEQEGDEDGEPGE